MSWQKCPLCGGFGSIGVGFPTGETCSACEGCGVINDLTGAPLRRVVTSAELVIQPPTQTSTIPSLDFPGHRAGDCIHPVRRKIHGWCNYTPCANVIHGLYSSRSIAAAMAMELELSGIVLQVYLEGFYLEDQPNDQREPAKKV